MIFFGKSKTSDKTIRLGGMEDAMLIDYYRRTKDNRVIGEFFNRYAHLIYGVCYKYLENEEESKDAVMQVFDKLYESLLQFEIVSFRSWFYTVAKNHCLMILRKARTFRYNDNLLNKNCQEEIMENEGDDSLLRQLLTNGGEIRLAEAIGRLSEDQKTCIEMFYLQDLSYKDISDKTGYTHNQVKSYIQNGKRNLKIILEKSHETS